MNTLQQIRLLGERYNLPADWLEQRPQLFAHTTVAVSLEQQHAMRAIITAIESVITLPAYQEKVLSWAPVIAQSKPATHGVFLGYDFHLTAEGPKLIEINTNPGAAGILLLLAFADPSQAIATSVLQQRLLTMFQEEWQLARGDKLLQRIAIIDEHPQQQYFYPEFLLFQSLFKQMEIDAIIADPSQLTIRNKQLYANDLPIDLVYNRLTDFYLTNPQHAVLAEAYRENWAVLTPHPHAYALYADKRNLCVLSDSELLHDWGVAATTRAILKSAIPHTFSVDAQHAEAIWAMRKTLFFKPITGYGGKGTYRGRNITKKVFHQIINSHYIAQTLIPPSEHKIDNTDKTLPFKVDIRNYVYNTQVLNLIARVYQGQVTNFRAPGSGFALLSPFFEEN